MGFKTACQVIQNRAVALHLRCLLMPSMSLWRLMVISAFWRATSSRNWEVLLRLLPAACTSFPYICTTSKSFLKHGLSGEFERFVNEHIPAFKFRLRWKCVFCAMTGGHNGPCSRLTRKQSEVHPTIENSRLNSLSICQPEELRLLIDAVLAQRVVHGRPQLLLEDVLLALLIAALAPRGRSSFGRRRLCSLPTCGSKSDVRISFRRRHNCVDFY